jgi:DNA replication protein DnaC
MARRLRRARFEEQLTLEGFDFAASPKLPAAQIRDLAALRWLTVGESVILYGPVGVGKFHIAQALRHLAIRQGADVRFTKTSRLLSTLAGGHADRSFDKRLAELVRPRCSSATTSPCASTPRPRRMTSTNWSPRVHPPVEAW